MLGTCLFALAHFFPALTEVPKHITPQAALLREGVPLLVILGSTAVMARIEGRKLLSYGLAGPRRIFLALQGFMWGLVLLSALVGALSASGFLAFDGLGLQGSAALQYALAWLLVFALVAMTEETLYRGYLQHTLSRALGFWPAALVISIAFGLAHLRNPGELPLGITVAALAGVVFALALRLTGSLWWGIGFHAAWDWAQSFLFGTPDSGYVVEGHLMMTHPTGDARWSGGTAGPEGSLLFAPVLLLGLVVIWTTLTRSRSTAGN
jgi:membrane protease YdiL (CAAX protease family)